jgi:hypothetical protein
MSLLPSQTLSRLEPIDVSAPLPYLRRGATATSFHQMRAATYKGCGYDFLKKLDDLMRPRDYESAKPGVRNRSRHKCADTLDYNRADKNLIIIPEPKVNQMYWRTYIRCEAPYGQNMTLELADAGRISGRFFDFTACAERFGWMRIPARPNWTNNHDEDMREYYHYERRDNFTYEEIMAYLYTNARVERPLRKPLSERIFGLNDRGIEVRNLQAQLVALDLLERFRVNGIYDEFTEAAIAAFQNKIGLAATGMSGPATRARLLKEVISLTSQK